MDLREMEISQCLGKMMKFRTKKLVRYITSHLLVNLDLHSENIIFIHSKF